MDFMTLTELGSELKKMYDNAPKNSKSVMIHLFGIKYANEIYLGKYTATEIVKMAGITESRHAEVSKGIKLAKYVRVI